MRRVMHVVTGVLVVVALVATGCSSSSTSTGDAGADIVVPPSDAVSDIGPADGGTDATAPTDTTDDAGVPEDAAPETTPPPACEIPVGALVISEIQANPCAVDDLLGEWFEVHNPTGNDFDLAGCLIRDGGTEPHSHTIAVASLPIPAGGYIVLGVNADTESNGGIAVDYAYASIRLTNSADTLELVNDYADVIDAVSYDESWPDRECAAMQLAPGQLDATANDDAAAWCTAPGDEGDAGSPGATNPACPIVPTQVDWCRLHAPASLLSFVGETVTVTGRVRVTGLTDLTSGIDASGTFFGELGYGPDGSDPDGNAQWTWFDAVPQDPWDDAEEPGTDEYTAGFGAPAEGTYDMAYRFRLGAGAWLYCDTDATAEGGGDGSADGYQTEYAGALTIGSNPCVPDNPCTSPTGTDSCDGNSFVDVPSEGLCLPQADGSFECDYSPTTTDCSLGGGTCDPVLGCQYPTPDVVISELMIRSQSGSDNGEWVELTNTSTTEAFELEGCVLRDDVSNTHTITGSLIVPAGGVLLLAKSADSGENHGITPDYVYDNFNLGNSGDEVVLECEGTLVDRVEYGSSDVVLATSRQLDPSALDALANDDPDNWCSPPATATFGPANELLGTPGELNPPCPVPDFTVDWCRLQAPAEASVLAGTALMIYGRVYDEGITDISESNDPNASLTGAAGWGPVGSDPSTDDTGWTWVAASPNAAYGPSSPGHEAANDEYEAEITAPTPGNYDLAYRFSLDGGETWLYCDLDATADGRGDGSADGYDPQDAGSLETLTSPCSPNPCTEPLPNECDVDGVTWLVYPATGNCTVDGTDAVCSYPPESTDCSLREGTCQPGVGCVYPQPNVIVTEIMPRSQSGTDNGEWVELTNLSETETYDLDGCALRDDGTNNHTIVGPLEIAPGGVLLLARSDDSTANHGITPDYVYGGSFGLANTGDEVILVCDDFEIDRMSYGSSQVVLGVSLQLAPAAYDATLNDDADNWCHPGPDATYGTDNLLGTPGEINPPCPDVAVDWCRLQSPTSLTGVVVGTDVAIYGRVFEDGLTNLSDTNDADPALSAEVGYGPDGSNPSVDDTDWVWTTAAANDAYGPGSPAHEPDNDEYVGTFAAPDAGSYDTAYRFSLDGGLTWLYCDTDARPEAGDGSADGYDPANAGVLATIADPCSPNPCDAPADDYCTGTGEELLTHVVPGTCTPTEGGSYDCAYDETTVDCANDGNICRDGACVPPSSGMPTAAGQVIVTELMPYAWGLAQADGDWFEVTNTSEATLDLDGCVVSDDGTDSHTIAGSILLEPGGTAILVANEEAANIFGLNVAYVLDSGFTLEETGDEIVLTCGETEISRVLYDAELVALAVSAQLDADSYAAVASGEAGTWCLTPDGFTFGPFGMGGTPDVMNEPCLSVCDPNPCTDPLPATCESNGVTRVTYPSPGICTPNGEVADCAYPPETYDCSADGLVCEAGECVPPTLPQPAAYGDLIVTEFMPRSQSGSDPGEWVELHNMTAESTFGLGDCVLRDDVANTHTIVGPLTIGPGEYLVLGASGDPAANHGLDPDYVYSNFFLGNDGDSIVLECSATEIARWDYTGGDVVLGVAWQLDPTDYAVAAAGDPVVGCEAPVGTTYGTDGLLGSPGLENPACRVVDTAVDWCRLQFPEVATGVAAGTQLTVYGRVYEEGFTDQTDYVDPFPELLAEAGYGAPGSNPSLDTTGWTWLTAAGNALYDPSAPDHEPPYDEYMATYAAPAPGNYAHAFRFSLDGGASWLYCDINAGPGMDGSEDGYGPANEGVLETVVSACYPDPCTTPLEPTCDESTDVLTSWSLPATCALDGDAATCTYTETVIDCIELGGECLIDECVLPRAPAADEVIFTEILYDTDAEVGESYGEWVELYNLSAERLSLDGCVLSDAAANETTLAGIFIEPGGYVLLARSVDPSLNGGLTPDGTFSFGLNNGGDTVTLTCAGAIIDTVAYDAGGDFLDETAVSISLDPAAFDATTNNDGASWCFGIPRYYEGASSPTGDHFGTPGAPNDDCVPPDWCRLQWPPELDGYPAGLDVSIYGRVLHDGLTTLTVNNDLHPALTAELGYGADGSDPTSAPETWTWIAASPEAGYGPGSPAHEPLNDEYVATLTIPSAGTYDYAFRFSLDGGRQWRYCDLDRRGDGGADGSSDGYAAEDAGHLVAIDGSTRNLIFSEYVEGPVGTQALEIANLGAETVYVHDCVVVVYEGATTPGPAIPLDAFWLPTAAAVQFHVLCNDAIPGGACDQLSADLVFDGDDAIELACGGITMDIIGQFGTDPGDYWGTAPNTTQDHTMYRKCTVTQGDWDGSDTFDPAVEWDIVSATTGDLDIWYCVTK